MWQIQWRKRTPRTRLSFLTVRRLAQLKTLPAIRERPISKVKQQFGRFRGVNASISASRENTGECDFAVLTTEIFLYFQIISFAAQVLVGFQQPSFMTEIKYYFVILLLGFFRHLLFITGARSSLNFLVEVLILLRWKPSLFTLWSVARHEDWWTVGNIYPCSGSTLDILISKEDRGSYLEGNNRIRGKKEVFSRRWGIKQMTLARALIK